MNAKKDQKRFNLQMTHDAYDAVLDHTFKYGLFDPLPVLLYDKDTDSYTISAFTSADVDEKMKNGTVEHPYVYHVGRLRMCIENIDLVNQVDGKTLDYDYINRAFVIK